MKIILLSYLSRSGSTYLSNILARDKRFCVCPEAEVLTRNLLDSPNGILQKKAFDKLQKAFQYDRKLKHWAIKAPEYISGGSKIDLFKRTLTQFKEKTNPEADFILFKSEGLEGFYAQDNSDFYKIILLRDPRAIFYSQKINRPSSGKGKMNINPIRLTKKFNNLYKSFFVSEKCILTKYESIVTNKAQELLNLSNFLKISSIIEDSASNVIDIIPENQKHLHVNLEQENLTKPLYKWQHHLSNYEIFLIQKHLDETISELYNPIDIKMNLTKRFIGYLRLLIFDSYNRALKLIFRYVK
jgi:hypothetical protein